MNLLSQYLNNYSVEIVLSVRMLYIQHGIVQCAQHEVHVVYATKSYLAESPSIELGLEAFSQQ